MNNEIKKEVTIENIAELINASSTKTKEDLAELITETKKSLETKIDSVEEKLATMTQNEFIKVNEKINNGFKKVNSKIDNLELEVKNRRTHVFDHKDLEHRVEKLEEKNKKYDSLFPKTAKSSV